MLFSKVVSVILFFELVLSWWLLPAAAEPTLSLVPVSQEVPAGQRFALDITITNVEDLFSFEFDVTFNPSVLTALRIIEGPFLPSGGATFFIPGTINNATGTITGTIIATADTLIGPIPGVSGGGTLATVEFEALAPSTSPITLSNVLLLDSTLAEITPSTVDGSVTVTTIPEPSICSFLGNDPLPSLLDQDIFTFAGMAGEHVAISVEKAPMGVHTGERLTLILIDQINGVFLFSINSSALPNEITATLPVTGIYQILVTEQPKWVSRKRFRGAYCLTLESSGGASQTLTPTAWVEYSESTH